MELSAVAVLCIIVALLSFAVGHGVGWTQRDRQKNDDAGRGSNG